MTTKRADVLVVGAGPSGSATAIFLARAGHEVHVLDRARFPRVKPCAEYASPAAVRLLGELGVLDAVRRAGAVTLSGMRVRAPNGEMLTGEWAAAREFRGTHGNGLSLRREKLDQLLVDAARAAGAVVHEGVHVCDIERDGGGRVSGVVLDDGTVHRARLVVGADGLRSVVARRLALGAYASWPRRFAFVTHYRGVDGARTHGEMHVEYGGYAGVAPVDDGLTNAAVVIPATGARDAARDATSFVERWLRRPTPLGERFARAERASPVRAVGPFGWRVRRAWGQGVALVGDAAEFLDPFTGEGIYAALRGAEILSPFASAACVAANVRDADDALRAYEEARRRVFRGKWIVERLVAGAVGAPWAMNRVARGLSRRRDLADTLVGVTGDVVPAGAVLRPSYALALARAAFI